MRKPLKSNTILKGEYIISGLLSVKGSSSLIYKAHVLSEDGEVQTMNPVIIKEFYPKEWSDKGYLERSSNEILCDTEYRDAFCKELECFKEQSVINNVCGYDESSDTRSIASSYMEFFLENQTGYIVSTSFNGVTLSQYSKKTGIPKDKKFFIQTVKLIESMTYAVKEQHRSGYLNLDVTPDNLLLSQTGNGYTISVIDYGSCLPLCESYTKDDIELVARRVTHSGEYSSKNVKSLYKDKRHFLLTDDDSKYDWYEEAIKRVSPTDDVYSIGVTFFEMFTNDRKIGNYNKALASINYLNAAEKDWLLHVFQQIVEMRYENIEQFLYDLDYLKNVLALSKTNISKHVLWSSSIDYYEKNKNKVVFKTEHKPLLNHGIEYPKLVINAVTEEGLKDSAMKIIKSKGDDNIYLYGAGGAGKSFVAAELYINNLEKQNKIPFYYDLADLNTVDGADFELVDEIIRDILLRYLGIIEFESIDALKNEFSKYTSEKEYFFVLDNLHKVENYHEVIKEIDSISEILTNVQILLLGRGELLSKKTAKNFLKLKAEGFVKDEEQDNQFWTEIPLFYMISLEEGYENELDVNEGSMLWRYFKGIKGYNNSSIAFSKIDELYQVKNSILPQIAYDCLVLKKKLFEDTISNYCKIVSADEFEYLAIDVLGIIEKHEGKYKFIHDIFLEYFASVYIAGSIKKLIDKGILDGLIEINDYWPAVCSYLSIAILIEEYKSNGFKVLNLIFLKLIDLYNEKKSFTKVEKFFYNIISLFWIPKVLTQQGFSDTEVEFTYSLKEIGLEFEISKWFVLGTEVGVDRNLLNKYGVYLLLYINKKAAVKVFEKAAALGSREAKYNLGIVYMQLYDEKSDNIQYFHISNFWFAQALKEGCVYSKPIYNKQIESLSRIDCAIEKRKLDFFLKQFYQINDIETIWSDFIETLNRTLPKELDEFCVSHNLHYHLDKFRMITQYHGEKTKEILNEYIEKNNLVIKTVYERMALNQELESLDLKQAHEEFQIDVFESEIYYQSKFLRRFVNEAMCTENKSKFLDKYQSIISSMGRDITKVQALYLVLDATVEKCNWVYDDVAEILAHSHNDVKDVLQHYLNDLSIHDLERKGASLEPKIKEVLGNFFFYEQSSKSIALAKDYYDSCLKDEWCNGEILYNLAVVEYTKENRHTKESFEFLSAAANIYNYWKAQLWLGVIFAFGDEDGNENVVEGIKYLEAAERNNCVDASFILAEIYYYGLLGNEINYGKSKMYYRKANVESLNEEIIDYLSSSQHNGERNSAMHKVNNNEYLIKHLVEVKIRFAKLLYDDKDTSFSDRCIALNIMYSLAKDGNALAFNIIKEWSELPTGYRAIIALGDLYLFGYGVDSDLEKAFYEYAKFDDLCAYCMMRIGEIYYRRGGEFLTSSLKWYRKAADLYGNGDLKKGLKIISSWYDDNKNPVGAMVKYYNFSEQIGLDCENNNETVSAEDLFCWAMAIGNGIFFDYSKDEAFYYLERSGEKGHKEAQLTLGNLYLWGDMWVEKNEGEAKRWLTLAAKGGHVVAQNNLGYCFETEKNYDKALYWYSLSSENGFGRAKYHLGYLYEHGLGVNVNIALAKNLYEEARNKGDKDAKIALDKLQN